MKRRRKTKKEVMVITEKQYRSARTWAWLWGGMILLNASTAFLPSREDLAPDMFLAAVGLIIFGYLFFRHFSAIVILYEMVSKNASRYRSLDTRQKHKFQSSIQKRGRNGRFSK